MTFQIFIHINILKNILLNHIKLIDLKINIMFNYLLFGLKNVFFLKNLYIEIFLAPNVSIGLMQDISEIII